MQATASPHDYAYLHTPSLHAPLPCFQVRQGKVRKPTAGYCGTFAQANLVSLPKAEADDFMLLCQRNPKPCPLLGVGEPGQWSIPLLGDGIDVRTDVPGYYVYRAGDKTQELDSLLDIWQPDFVVFAIGCSFSFEQMLVQAGQIGSAHV